ncbi:hypothetical protein [Desulfoluna butyratoxydans]|uniref:Uncharacterized protein n=1 Tax=Desulfoluna butyratoxydans TaxID=231438 RepID=A0A4U8YT93_9BACT|nr:hypothetical protein [Desulfoluna butyratoxydans]VFQ46777.1 hypothetical protein MSL71_44530 [Desulfoluna butyratoxydans]
MEIEQKRYLNRTRFTFEKERLSYAMGQESGSRSFGVYYADIPMETTMVEARNSWFRNAAAVLGIVWVCSLLTWLAVPSQQTGPALYLPIAASICLIIYRFAFTRYTVLKTESGDIYLISGKRHDEIFDELMKRRKSQLLSWYGEIDYANDPGEEIRKFHWLKVQGVIGDEEFESIRTRIEVFHGPMQETDFMEGPSIN